MLKKQLLPILILLITLGCYVALVPDVKQVRGKYLQEKYTRIGNAPSPLLQAMSLEFQGTVADFLMLKTISYMGHSVTVNSSPSKEDWQAMFRALDLITDLDPRFWDPYVFAETMLAWQAGMFDEAAILLAKAVLARPDDYRPNYFLGFNSFYFQGDPAKAAPYLREAATRSNAPSYIQALATRMSVYGSQTMAAIILLEELVADTYDPLAKKQLSIRLETLKMLFSLEQALAKYRKDSGNFPDSLSKLVTSGYIKTLPEDPYGGEFVLLANGRVYSTSNLLRTK